VGELSGGNFNRGRWIHRTNTLQEGPDSVYHRKIKEAFSLDLLDHADCDRLAHAMYELNREAVRQRYDNYKAEMPCSNQATEQRGRDHHKACAGQKAGR
jgi:hypothetical protein